MKWLIAEITILAISQTITKKRLKQDAKVVMLLAEISRMIQNERPKPARRVVKTVMAVAGRLVSRPQKGRIAVRAMEEISPMIPKKLLRLARKVVSIAMEGIINRKAA
jgi:hypothetical protein